MRLSKTGEEALNNFAIKRNYSSKELEKVRERIAGEFKGKGYVLVINKKYGGFFGINQKGNVIKI